MASEKLLAERSMLIRDPVHGDIALAPRDAAVLDFPEVQRLRGIKQLGTASLVYPGACHTRFDHSLGASFVARRILASLRDSGVAVDAEIADAVCAATLLHDITHLPFGHTLEDERRLFARHDKGERMRQLFDGGLGERLERLGLFRPVAAILGVAAADEIPAWAREIVSSTIDADLLDYLRRDSYFTGLSQSYDARMLSYFSVADGHLAIDMCKHGMERPDARSETVQVLRLRYFLTERVYYHHTKVAAGAMISKAVELAQGHGQLSEAELLRSTDGDLFARLAALDGDPAIAELLRRLQQRALLKRGYVISALTVPESARRLLIERFHSSAANRGEAERHIARAVGCRTEQVIVYCPALSVMKEAAAMVRTPQGVLRLNDSERLPSLEIQALEARYAGLWRLYVFVPEEFAGDAAAPAREIFGVDSEYRRGSRPPR